MGRARGRSPGVGHGGCRSAATETSGGTTCGPLPDAGGPAEMAKGDVDAFALAMAIRANYLAEKIPS